jgi:hypothetical protein
MTRLMLQVSQGLLSIVSGRPHAEPNRAGQFTTAKVRPLKLRKVPSCADVRAPLAAMVYVHVRLKAMLSAVVPL